MKQSRQIPVLTIFICLFFSLSFAQTDFQREDTEFSDLIQRSKKGIVAIGTFHFNTKPTVQFAGTGFVIGNGTRIVTNLHVVAAIKEKKRLFNLRVFHQNLPMKGIKATLLAEDAFHDLAILEIQKKNLPPPPFSFFLFLGGGFG